MIHRALEHRLRAFVALALVALAALTLAACGSDDSDGGSGGGGDSADARTLLEETFSGTKDVRSGRLGLTIRLAEEGGGDSFSVGLSGPFESQGEEYPKFDMALDADLGAQGRFSAGMISTSDRLFVEVEGNAYEIPEQYLEMARQQTGTEDRRLAIPDIDPQSWIDDPEVVGQEEVGGVETEHISGTVNVGALLDSIDSVLAEIDRQGLGGAAGGQVPTEIPADARADVERAVSNARVDVWTGSDDKTLRKLEVTLDVEAERAGERGGNALFSLELTGLNEEQTIEAPTDTRPIDELLQGLSALMGGAISPGGGSGPSTDDLGAYQRCLEDAGADVAAAQRCADLVAP